MGSNEALWASVRLRGRIPAGIDAIAKACHWKVKRRRDGTTLVAPLEYFPGSETPLFAVERLVDASNPHDLRAYEQVASALAFGDTHRLGDETYEQIDQEVKRLTALDTNPANWQAMTLLIRTAPDDALADLLHRQFAGLVDVFPSASLWLLSLNPAFEHRRASIRVMFGAEHLAEVVEKQTTQAEFEGIQTASAFRSDLHIQTFINAFLLSQAPWTLGLVFERYNGAVVILFGVPQGSRSHDPHLMTDLNLPSYSSAASYDVLMAPELDPETVEKALEWWVSSLANMFSVVLDITRFCAPGDEYKPEQHFGALLSLERFAASVTSILGYYRRDEFVRRMLMYDALDLLDDGLGLGDYELLANRAVLARYLTRLEETLPPEAAALLLPRVRRTLHGLEEMESEFFLEERITDEGIRLPSQDDGQPDVTRPLALAVAQYIHALRDSNHGFRRDFTKRLDRLALFSAHTGRIPDVVSDVPWLHFLRMLAQPDRVLNNAGLRPKKLKS